MTQQLCSIIELTYLANKHFQSWMPAKGIFLKIIHLPAACSATDNAHVFNSYKKQNTITFTTTNWIVMWDQQDKCLKQQTKPNWPPLTSTSSCELLSQHTRLSAPELWTSEIIPSIDSRFRPDHQSAYKYLTNNNHSFIEHLSIKQTHQQGSMLCDHGERLDDIPLGSLVTFRWLFSSIVKSTSSLAFEFPDSSSPECLTTTVGFL